MSFTRFRYDLAREQKYLQQSTDVGRYMLNVPGPGENTEYVASPFVRLQKFGGNNMTNSVNLESDLKGLTRNTNRDQINYNDYKKQEVTHSRINYNSNDDFDTKQSRATHPAWLYKDLGQNNFQYLFLDPQENICIPFNNNLSSRILEKDYYVPKSHQFNNL